MFEETYATSTTTPTLEITQRKSAIDVYTEYYNKLLILLNSAAKHEVSRVALELTREALLFDRS